ncbi:hypothetical protein BO70DRAFT_362777 [Aspergillus heteromorphus CBS 117.55]|uniref:Uncharacterized protein n=1 Tax=Aspergillus heteromorphus CBS 117.55 TaxID=1448321 RepID=A0A317W2V6_9EURO|nr:uncharacterized protein BO70DRAFT_362777 [Aspergillus heteromorphus CBS 117.55]PWY79612.1 hypothetical protein BO70DRAFT_362777 [Aspergillus heteromorphus CBS 117.55]
MDHRSGRLLAHADAFPPSSSALPRRRWSQLNPLHASPVVDTVRPLQQTHPYRHGHDPDSAPALDESSRAHRTTALRQLNGINPRPAAPSWSWKSHRRPPPTTTTPPPPPASRPATLSSPSPSQPVLVRAYSGGPHDPSATTTMPSRRSFPFITGSRSGRQRRAPALPSEEDFSIDSILRAIEPNIRHTLDSIGEICGRSRLSLANEYGSHIAPLGEIRAPGGLVTVDEASSDHERQAANVAIYDDETSLTDGRDHSSFSHYRYRDTSGQAATGRIPPSGDASSAQAQPIPTTPRAAAALELAVATDESLGSLPTTREFASQPRSSGRTLLGKQGRSDMQDRPQSISTPALVSEILLDAQAEGRRSGQPGSSPRDTPHTYRPLSLGASALLLGWLRPATVASGPEGKQATAEMQLRAMLGRYESTATA